MAYNGKFIQPTGLKADPQLLDANYLRRRIVYVDDHSRRDDILTPRSLTITRRGRRHHIFS